MAGLEGQRLGQYEILMLLGEGGMAAVYRARQTSVQRDVAVKVIKTNLLQMEEFTKRFAREAQTIASLSHIHILKVFDYGQQDDMVFLVMELLTGGSLADLIGQGPLTLERTSDLLSQMASALDYAHSQSIIHRDMKPQNILLDRDGNAFITDFGIAKIMGGQSTTKLTQGGTMGTPAYMAPEQWRGDPVDARADVYSLGVILFEMLTGKLPFTGDTAFGLMHKHVYEAPPPIRDVRPDLSLSIERVINKALAKNREERFGSAGELARAFDKAVRGEAWEDTGSIQLLIVDEPSGTPATSSTAARGGMGSQPIAQTGRVTGTPTGAAPTGPQAGTGAQPVGAPTQGRSSLPLILAGLAALVIVAVVVVLIATNSGSTASTATTTQAVVAVEATSTPEAPSPTARPTDTATATLAPSDTPDVAAIIRLTSEARQQATVNAILALSATPNEAQLAATFLAETDTASTAIAVASLTKTPTPTATATMTATATLTATPSLTPTLTSTSTLSATATATSIPTEAASPTPAASPTEAITATAIAAVPPAATPFGGGTGLIVFASNRDGNQEIYTIRADGTDAVNLTNNSSDDYSPMWSPDGRRILYVSRRGGNQEIYVMDADGQNPTRLTNDRAEDYDPAWSPDGTKIAFTSNRVDTADIWVMNADGSGVKRLTTSPATDNEPIWAPDGKAILFNSTREGSTYIFVMNADGSDQRRIVPRAGRSKAPSFSPDGKQIVYAFQPQNGGGGSDILVMDPDGKNARPITTGPDVDTYPVWSPDGQHIVFLTNRRLQGAIRSYTIYIVRPDGSDLGPISLDPLQAVEGRIGWQPKPN